MARPLQIGDTIDLFMTFYDKPEDDETREPGDPDVVTLTVQKPNGVTTSYTDGFDHVTDSGYYSRAIVLDQSGRWAVRWLGTGGIVTSEADESKFYVELSEIRA